MVLHHLSLQRLRRSPRFIKSRLLGPGCLPGASALRISPRRLLPRLKEELLRLKCATDGPRHFNQAVGSPRKAGAQVEGGGGGRRGRLSLIYEIFSLLLDLDTRSWNRLHSTFIPWQRRRGTRQWHCL